MAGTLELVDKISSVVIASDPTTSGFHGRRSAAISFCRVPHSLLWVGLAEPLIRHGGRPTRTDPTYNHEHEIYQHSHKSLRFTCKLPGPSTDGAIDTNPHH
jgi:hypothetical protein